MLAKTSAFLDRTMRRYTPDPFIFAIALTFIVFLFGLYVNDRSPQEMITYWGEGFWSLIPFTMQMVMILVTGYIVATSRPINHLLRWVAKRAKTTPQAIFLTTFIALVGCWLNWGFGLVIGAFLCRTIARIQPKINYKLLVASAYSGFLIWHGGLSGSIPLLLATPDNFSLPLVGRLLPLSETLFSSTNLLACFGLIILLPLTNVLMHRKEDEVEITSIEQETPLKVKHSKTPAERLETTRVLPLVTTLLAFFYLLTLISNQHFSLDINCLNFLFLFLGILLHGRLCYFLDAAKNAAHKISPLLIQYPFYAGIMGMMQHSGLAASISELFVAISTPESFPLLTFYSAGIVNFFVPSGGGQWAVQSPIVIPAAIEIGADLSKSVMAVAWGDAWTNMAQPFWALPLLSVAGLKIRDIMGYCIMILLISGLFLSLLFYFA